MEKKLVPPINIRFRKAKLKKRAVINETPKERAYKKKLPLIFI